MKAEWVESRLNHLRNLKSPSEHQRLLLLLVDKPDRSAEDEKKISALLRAERAAERAQRERASAARIVNDEKRAARKARDHELYQAAGLLILAGLVDSKTGKPTRDRGELLGALMAVSSSQRTPERTAQWKKAGDALLSKNMKTSPE